jgi:hypothetical protein
VLSDHIVLLLLLGAAALGLYFLPTVVALVRGVRDQGSIFVINLFLGWLLVGWVVALAMALRSQLPAPTPVGGALTPSKPAAGDLTAPAGPEVCYATLTWSDGELREIRRRLTERGVTHSLEDGELIVSKRAEPLVDQIVVAVTGDQITER